MLQGFGIFDSRRYNKKKMVTSLPQIEFPQQVCEECVVANNTKINFHKESHGEQRRHWRWCIMTYVAQYIHLQMEVKDT